MVTREIFIIFSLLFAYFVYVVANSAKKLSQARIASTTKTSYSAEVLFPSISICLGKMTGNKDLVLNGGHPSMLAEPLHVSNVLLELSYAEGTTRYEIMKISKCNLN